MYALEARRDHRTHAEQGVPLAAQSRACRSRTLRRNHDQRHAVLFVAHRGVVDGHLFAVGLMRRIAAFDAGHIWLRSHWFANAPRTMTRGSCAARRNC